jgi:hypothetical protein
VRSDSSLTSLTILAIIAIAPLIAATFVGRRMGYRGIGLIAPWIAAVGFGLLIGLGLGQVQLQFEPVGQTTGAPANAASAWAAGLLLSGYFTTVVYLIVLAARRLPARPVDSADVF